MEDPDDQQPAVHEIAEHLFRHEAGKIISTLTGIYGARNLQLAEDMVQEAMIRAVKTWPIRGIPDNPAAWLLQAAKNLAVDHLRREKTFLGKQQEVIETNSADTPADPIHMREEEFTDDQLRLLFICCHPNLPQESQVALALKTLFAFHPKEIAAAFLVSEAAISKRLVRARQRIRDERIPFEIPGTRELPARLEGVLETLYLLFNEGHKASHGDDVIRTRLCLEALRITSLITTHPTGNLPHTHALASLMAFTAARLPARTDAEGNLIRLEDQDRTKWDGDLIQTGVRHLANSRNGTNLGKYHLQAGIAACHTLAPDDTATDWKRILGFYDHLVEVAPSPVIYLNRAIAFARIHGPGAAIREIERTISNGELNDYYLLHAVLADLEIQRNNRQIAANHLREAIGLTKTAQEHSFLAKRLENCLL